MSKAICFGPIDEAWVAAYARASGDDNPIHRRSDEANLHPIIHGALLAALMERAIVQLLPDKVIIDVAVQFLRPARVGSIVFFRLGQSRPIVWDGETVTQHRVIAEVDGGKPCLLADCSLV